jgi:mono/diheme cytochrome c family protein
LPPQPETPPPAPVEGEPTFDANIGPLFAAKCTACHGATASAGLNLSTYADAIKGGDNGPVIVAGDSAGSKLVEVQRGTHFATLSAEELDLVIQWIDAGAPEN